MKKTPIPTDQDREVAKMLLHQQESDRGCVIFSAAMLEEDLESLLRAHCPSGPILVKEVIDPLFRGYAPLSTFAAKIQVSYAFGLIPEQLYKTLNLIRKLRNDFAHEKQAVSFQTPKYQDLLKAVFMSDEPEAVNATSVQPGDDELMRGMGQLTKGQFVERLAFCIFVTRMSARLRILRDMIRR